MPLRCVVPALVAGVVLCVCAPVAGAHPPKQDGAVVAPIHRIGGLTGPELLAESWTRSLLVSGEDPYAGGCAPVGKALELIPNEQLTAECTAPKGTKVLMMPGANCSDVEEPPFYGEDEAAQAACARAFSEQALTSILVSVDGGPPVQIRAPEFELVSPQRTVELPPDNTLGVEPGPASFVAFSWGAAIKGLDVGTRTVEAFGRELGEARTVFWNGPMGVFELAPFQAGTRGVAEAVAAVAGLSVVGGGDSAAAVRQLGLDEAAYGHISTGGGPSLEYLEGRELPGLAVLADGGAA